GRGRRPDRKSASAARRDARLVTTRWASNSSLPEMPEIESVSVPLAPHASSGTQNGSGRPANEVVIVPLVLVTRYCSDTPSIRALCGLGNGNPLPPPKLPTPPSPV